MAKDFPSYLDFPKEVRGLINESETENKPNLEPVSKELLERFQIGKKCYEVIEIPSGYYKVRELNIIGVILLEHGKELKVIFSNNVFVYVNNNNLDDTINVFDGKNLYLSKDKALKVCEESLSKVIEDKKEELNRLEHEFNNLEL